MKLRRTMKAQSPKKKEKERNKKRISVRPEGTCNKKKDPDQAKGYATRRINIKALGS